MGSLAPQSSLASGATGQEELFLLPGQWWYGRAPRYVRTLLGSCVAVTLWHPRWKLGAMCHYLLPDRPRGGEGALDGRYGEEAIALLHQAVLRDGLRPAEFETRVYGGGNMFPDHVPSQETSVMDIGARNVALALRKLSAAGFGLLTNDSGGALHRQIALDIDCGVVTLRAGAVQ